MLFKGLFQITNWDESALQQLPDTQKITQAKVTQSYQGDILGNSEIHYVMNYDKDGNAKFVGFEVIEATVNGQECQLTLQHNGTFEQGIAKSHFLVLASSSLPEIINLTGTFSSAENGKANYCIGE